MIPRKSFSEFMDKKNEERKKERGIRYLSVKVLFFMFLYLKLTGQIDWSWWWITAPLWIVATLACLGLIFEWLTEPYKNIISYKKYTNKDIQERFDRVMKR